MKKFCRTLPMLICVVTVMATYALAQVQGAWVTTTNSMTSARSNHAQVTISTGALAAGGTNGTSVLASAEIYTTTTGNWTATGSMTQARQNFPAVVLSSGKVLVAGGSDGTGTPLAGTELYDPSTGTWSSAGFLSQARYGHTATLLQSGKVLVTGGCTATGCSTYTAISELYDPTANSWSTTGNLNTARDYHTAVLLNTGKVLAIGGATGSTTTTSCELYDPSAGTWSSAASTNTARYLSTATVLSDGKVLATGGASGRYPLNSAELYDPTANTWTATGTMTIGRYAHTAALLGDGTVLVAGGEGQSISCGRACTGYIPTAKVDIYNESTGKFTATAGMSRARAYHSMTVLGTGRALASGGMGYISTCCIALNVAEIYTPLTLTFSASSLNFGLLEVGLTSPPQTVTVTNVSNHSATFTSIASSGDFAQSNNCPTTLNAGQNCTITVTFSPTAAGTRSGAVILTDDCPGSPTQTITLTGTGEAGALGFTPASLNFGNVLVGYSSTLSATLTNDSGAAVTITAIAISPSNSTFTQTNNCPATLNVQQTCTFQVKFTPPDVFTYNATLSVSNSASGPATLPLSGTGADN